MNKEEIETLVDAKVSAAIELRKKQVTKQFGIWSVAITSVFSFLLFIGFSKEEIVAKFRDFLVPKSHLVGKLIDDDNESKRLKDNILAELHDPTLKDYPDVKLTIEKNVWETVSTSDTEKIKEFLSKSRIDEEIINSYYQEVNQVLFDPEPSQKKSRAPTIQQLGNSPKPVKIGVFNNTNNAKTNCSLPFRQNKKRVIIYFPPSSKKEDGSDSYPYYKCPSNYPTIVVTLKIEDVEVDGVRVIGVERPTKEDSIQGVRARVTRAVAQEFETKGISLGSHVTSGTMRIVDVFEG